MALMLCPGWALLIARQMRIVVLLNFDNTLALTERLIGIKLGAIINEYKQIISIVKPIESRF
jgi:hypothetical protein